MNKSLAVYLPEQYNDWEYSAWRVLIDSIYYAYNFICAPDVAFLLESFYFGMTQLVESVAVLPGAVLPQLQVFGQIKQNQREDIWMKSYAPQRGSPSDFNRIDFNYFFPAGSGFCLGIRGNAIGAGTHYGNIVVKGKWFFDKGRKLGVGVDYRFTAGVGVVIIPLSIPG